MLISITSCNLFFSPEGDTHPKPSPKGGRPANDHRTVINGILWILRTGAPWRDLPEHYGAWETVSGRFYAWRKQGLWQKILKQVQQQSDAAGEFD